MFGYEYDAETGGLLLNDSTPNSSKEPRPVYAAEMRMLHMDEWFTFTDQDDSPYMWAEAASYYYRGQLVARTKGGSLCEAPVMDYLVAAAESGEKVPAVPQGYIELNYEKEINRKDLSALVFLNPDYMDRVFKEQEGISVNRYINKVRMEKAQLLLEKTQMQVLEIADKVGYSSLSNFNMQFKQYCGLSPNQYRKRIRNRQNVEIQ